MLTTEEKGWLELLQTDDEQAMEKIFQHYYKYLVVTSYNILNDDAKAKDLVQDTFFDLWQKRNELTIDLSLKAYLRRAVINKSIDEIRRRKKLVFNDEIVEQQVEEESLELEEVDSSDLQAHMMRAIELLPEKCKVVFKLSRFEGLAHKEIAAELGISTKTIENQITKALKLIRKNMGVAGRISMLAWIYFVQNYI